MGTYEDHEIIKPGSKRVPFQIVLKGEKLDSAIGIVEIQSMLRDSQKDIVLDDEGNLLEEKNKYIPGTAKNHTIDIAEIVKRTYLNGNISGAEVVAAIAEITDLIFKDEL